MSGGPEHDLKLLNGLCLFLVTTAKGTPMAVAVARYSRVNQVQIRVVWNSTDELEQIELLRIDPNHIFVIDEVQTLSVMAEEHSPASAVNVLVLQTKALSSPFPVLPADQISVMTVLAMNGYLGQATLQRNYVFSKTQQAGVGGAGYNSGIQNQRRGPATPQTENGEPTILFWDPETLLHVELGVFVTFYIIGHLESVVMRGENRSVLDTSGVPFAPIFTGSGVIARQDVVNWQVSGLITKGDGNPGPGQAPGIPLITPPPGYRVIIDQWTLTGLDAESLAAWISVDLRTPLVIPGIPVPPGPSESTPIQFDFGLNLQSSFNAEEYLRVYPMGLELGVDDQWFASIAPLTGEGSAVCVFMATGRFMAVIPGQGEHITWTSEP